MFRARGYTTGGLCSSSGGIVETLAGAPFVTAHPLCRTNDFGTAATFSVQALGSASFAYEWRKDGVLLAEGGNVSGTHQATLVLSPVAGADAGDYDVVVLNSLGAVTSSVARLTVVDPIIVVQPVRQRGAKGSSVTLVVTAAGTGSLHYRWRKDGVALPDAVSNTLVFSQVSLSDTGDYDVMVSNDWDTVASGSAALDLVAEVDPSFAPSFSGEVRGVAVQPDGRILAGGVYTAAVRLKRDGTTDTWYKASGQPTYGLAVQADGKSLQAAGSDPSLFGSTGLVRRVYSYGVLDRDLIGWNAGVRVALPQPDGRLLLGGSLLSFGNPGVRIERVFPDGSRDNTFALGASSGLCWTLALQPDGRILVGGAFTALGTQNRANIGRLLADGSVDGTFNPGANYSVNAIAVQADGKILIGGSFTVVAGQTRNRLARLFPDGTLDASFNPNANASVSTLALHTDGRIVVGGSFTTLGGVVRNRIARLFPDGTPDPAFDPGANGTVQAVAVDAEGSVLAGGAFTELGGLPRQRMARVLTTRAVTSALDHEGNRLHWRRSGPAPETWRVTFEHSADWAHWTPLGEGTRCVDGWELQDVAPTGGAYRAIGYTVGGLGCGSSGLVEATFNFSQSDSHGDGLPDWWYARYGLDPTGPSVADDDWDGDGLSNREERTAGTDPLDRTSRFAITRARIFDSGHGPPGFATSFGTVPGRIYSLETRESLTQGDWVRSSSIMASGTGSGYAVSMTPDRTNCFVRIVVAEP